jgi:hypothetical protein
MGAALWVATPIRTPLFAKRTRTALLSGMSSVCAGATPVYRSRYARMMSCTGAASPSIRTSEISRGGPTHRASSSCDGTGEPTSAMEAARQPTIVRRESRMVPSRSHTRGSNAGLGPARGSNGVVAASSSRPGGGVAGTACVNEDPFGKRIGRDNTLALGAATRSVVEPRPEWTSGISERSFARACSTS